MYARAAARVGLDLQGRGVNRPQNAVDKSQSEATLAELNRSACTPIQEQVDAGPANRGGRPCLCSRAVQTGEACAGTHWQRGAAWL